MDYTYDLLGILSSELEPYVHLTGDVRIDGVLTSAMKINDFIQQLLNKHHVSGALPADVAVKLIAALNDIKNWNDETEDEWGDPGERAADALNEYKSWKRQ